MSKAISKRGNYYAVLPANVRYDEQLSSSAKLLYAEITSLCDSNCQCFATNRYFAELYGMDSRTIRRLIAELESKNYVSVNIIKEQGNRRFINADSGSIIAAKINKKIADPTDKNVLSPCGQKCPDPMDKNVHTPLGHFCPAPINMNKSLNPIKRESEISKPASEKLQNPAPALDAVRKYFADKKYTSDPEHFHAHYEAKGWPVMAWDKAADVWEKRERKMYPGKGTGHGARGTSGKDCIVCGKEGSKFQNDGRGGPDKWLCEECRVAFRSREKNWGTWSREAIADVVDSALAAKGAR
jgi:hypothetical protein